MKVPQRVQIIEALIFPGIPLLIVAGMIVISALEGTL